MVNVPFILYSLFFFSSGFSVDPLRSFFFFFIFTTRVLNKFVFKLFLRMFYFPPAFSL